MGGTTAAISGVEQWPTSERFAEVSHALGVAYNALDELGCKYQVLNNEYAVDELADESSPVTAEDIAAVVHFLAETRATLEEYQTQYRTIEGWPELMADVRVDQMHRRERGESGGEER